MKRAPCWNRALDKASKRYHESPARTADCESAQPNSLEEAAAFQLIRVCASDDPVRSAAVFTNMRTDKFLRFVSKLMDVYMRTYNFTCNDNIELLCDDGDGIDELKIVQVKFGTLSEDTRMVLVAHANDMRQRLAEDVRSSMGQASLHDIKDKFDPDGAIRVSISEGDLDTLSDAIGQRAHDRVCDVRAKEGLGESEEDTDDNEEKTLEIEEAKQELVASVYDELSTCVDEGYSKLIDAKILQRSGLSMVRLSPLMRIRMS